MNQPTSMRSVSTLLCVILGLGMTGFQSSKPGPVTRAALDKAAPGTAASGSRVFATSFNQGIVEIDPATGAILNTFDPPVSNSVFDALAFDGTSLFFFNHGSDQENIYELNPDTGQIVDTHPFEGTAFMEGMAALNGRLYIMDRAANDIVIYDPSTDTTTGTIDVDGANPTNPNAELLGGLGAITTGGDALMASTKGNNIVEIDPVSGQILNAFAYTGSPIGSDIGLGVASGEILVGNNTGLTDQIIVYSRAGVELRRLTVPGSIGIQSIGADDVFIPSPNLIFTQYADGSAAGFANKTRVVLVAGSDTDTGQIRFLNESGAPQEVGIAGENRSSLDYSLPPHGALEIVTDGTGPLKRGPIEVYSDLGQGSSIRGAEVFELLGHSVSVPNAPPRNAQRIYVNFDAEERTAIAAYNPDGTQSVELLLVLTDETGTERGTKTLTLNPGEQIAKFLDEEDLFAAAVEAGFRGTLEISSGGRLFSLLSLIQKRSSGALIVVTLEQ